ncbi:MAG: aminotransferase class III-fold pyridoxal phosphate-dependent enzyme [Rikenellaceae bacterium]
MKLFDVYPINDIEITKAQGSTLWDSQGEQYLDMYGGHAVISIGHTNPRYVKMLSEQLSNLGFYSNSIRIPLQQQLADLLGELSGKSDYNLFLANSGAEANENALKLASFHTGRKKVVAFTGAFHGRTSLAVAATYDPKIIAPINQTDNIIFSEFNNGEALATLFAQQGDQIAAVIIEPIQGVGGIQIATTEFLKQIRSLCDQYGALMISDEVQCGCGRTGRYFALDHSGVEADIYSMAKGIGNGFPIGGIMISPAIEAKYGMLGTTFGGSHLAVTAAIAVAQEMLERDLMTNAAEMGEYIIKAFEGDSRIKEVRGEGLMIGIELETSTAQIRKDLLFKEHIFVGSAKNPNIIRLLPALTISQEACDRTIQAIKGML